jgi:hypothetical protein
MTTIKTGDVVSLFNRYTRRPLLGFDFKPSKGVVARCEDRVISVHHDGGAVTMIQGLKDPLIEVRKVKE